MFLVVVVVVVVASGVFGGFLMHTLLGGGGDDIPTVPLYVNCLALLRRESRLQFYENHLRTHLEQVGVVRTYLAGKWNILITRPDLLTEVFKNEHVFSKAGFRKKVPHGGLAYIFGDNIIDSHGEKWRSFMTCMKPGIQDRPADYQELKALSNIFVGLLLSEQSRASPGRGVSSDELARRWALEVAGKHFLQMDFETLSNPQAPLIRMLENVFGVGTTRLTATFPFFEKLDWLWPSRRDKFKPVDEFHNYLLEMAARTPSSSIKDEILSDFWKRASVLDGLKKGLREKNISDAQFLGNIATTLIVGHENILSLIKSAIWLLGKNPRLQAALRKEAIERQPTTKDEIDSMPLLASVVLETGRLYPPLIQLANRITLEPFVLGGKYKLPKGQWVGWNAYGVHTTPRVWGLDCLDFKPERWGNEAGDIARKLRRSQNDGSYITFNAHARKCLGMSFALFQSKVVLLEMLKRLSWSVDPKYKYKTSQGAVLAPVNALMIFKDLSQDDQNCVLK